METVDLLQQKIWTVHESLFLWAFGFGFGFDFFSLFLFPFLFFYAVFLQRTSTPNGKGASILRGQ